MDQWNHVGLPRPQDDNDTFDEMPSLRSNEERLGSDDLIKVKRRNSFSTGTHKTTLEFDIDNFKKEQRKKLR